MMVYNTMIIVDFIFIIVPLRLDSTHFNIRPFNFMTKNESWIFLLNLYSFLYLFGRNYHSLLII